MAAWIPIAIAALLGGGASAIASGRQARQQAADNRRAATGAQDRRERLLEIIGQINNRDLSGLDAQASNVFSRAANQIEANTAQRGVRNAPNAGAPRALNQTMAQVLANLAEARAQDQRQAQALIAQILGDESFGVVDPSQLPSPGNAGLIAGLGGFLGGAGQTVSNALGAGLFTPSGQQQQTQQATQSQGAQQGNYNTLGLAPTLGGRQRRNQQQSWWG